MYKKINVQKFKKCIYINIYGMSCTKINGQNQIDMKPIKEILMHIFRNYHNYNSVLLQRFTSLNKCSFIIHRVSWDTDLLYMI